MKRPSVGDRWQNRRTSRVCVVEAVSDERVRVPRVSYRYEDTIGKPRSQRHGTSLPHFVTAFTEFEKVAP